MPRVSSGHASGDARRHSMAAKYGKKSRSKVKKAMHERKRGTLKSGRSGEKGKSRQQAIALRCSEARRSGGKVPKKKSASKKRKGGAKKKSASRKKSGSKKHKSTKHA